MDKFHIDDGSSFETLHTLALGWECKKIFIMDKFYINYHGSSFETLQMSIDG